MEMVQTRATKIIGGVRVEAQDRKEGPGLVGEMNQSAELTWSQLKSRKPVQSEAIESSCLSWTVSSHLGPPVGHIRHGFPQRRQFGSSTLRRGVVRGLFCEGRHQNNCQKELPPESAGTELSLEGTVMELHRVVI